MAFEPSTEKAAWIRARFPEVDVRQMALSDEPGSVTFSINKSRTGYSGLLRYGEPGDEFEDLRVEKARLDDLLDPERRVDFLKVVVEGAELSVFHGARRTLERHRPILMFESAIEALERWGLGPEQVFAHVVGQGYEVFSARGILRREPPLDAAGFDRAHRYPYQAFKFFGLPSGGG